MKLQKLPLNLIICKGRWTLKGCDHQNRFDCIHFLCSDSNKSSVYSHSYLCLQKPFSAHQDMMLFASIHYVSVHYLDCSLSIKMHTLKVAQQQCVFKDRPICPMPVILFYVHSHFVFQIQFDGNKQKVKIPSQ